MKRSLLLSGLLFVMAKGIAQTVMIPLGSSTVETNTLFTTADQPWELKYGPGDSLWMTTKPGRVYRISPLTGASTLMLDYSSLLYQPGEAGMLGMAFHLDFANNPYVYIVYTYTSAGSNKERLSRFTYTNNALSPASEFILIDNVVANTNHDGSRLLVLPDNTILMTTGDALNTTNPQNNSSLNGKILRVSLDGTIPADNPIAGSYIYTTGHRNPQGLLLHPNGIIYETEHGPNEDDEFQIIEKGRNYGWPNVEGFCDNDIPNETAYCTANNIKEPLAAWNPLPAGTWAPNDMIWYNSSNIPDFQNTILVTFLKTEKVRRITLNAAGDGITGQTDFFVNQWGRLRDITVSPGGTIYLATNTSPFRIISMRNAALLPVTVTRYNVACYGNTANINWVTQSEINTKQFLLYRSADASNFTLFAAIKSKSVNGSSSTPISYIYRDSTATGKSFFYKLVSEDWDGHKKDMGIVASNCGNTNVVFSLLPNPSNGETILQITGSVSPVDVSVSNMAGQVVYQLKTNGRVVIGTGKWAPGIYNVLVAGQQKNTLFRQKLVVK